MSDRGGELVTADKPTVVSEPFLDAIVMEDSESDACFAYAPWTDESDRGEVFCKTDNLLDKLVASEIDPRWLWRQLSGRDIAQG